MLDDHLFRTLLNIEKSHKELIKNWNLEALSGVEEAVAALGNTAALRHSREFEQKILGITSMLEARYGTLEALENRQSALQISNALTSTALMLEQSVQTKMLESIRLGLANSDFQRCLGTMQETVGLSYIEAADMAFLRTSDLAALCQKELDIPSALSGSLSQLNVSAAKRLARIEELSFDVNRRQFYDETEPKITAKIPEMNSICGGAAVFDDLESAEVITELEMMNFQSYLAERPMFGSRHPVGEKIFAVVRDTDKLTDFEYPFYYHSRSRKNEEPPYTWDQMQKAPAGLPGAGRFNHPSQSHFYFADTKEGAEREVSIHLSAKEKEQKTLQTVRMKPRCNIKMIDLSGKFRRGYTTFLKYIRFPLGNDASQLPRVYLIPAFVSECCKECGIDGIKYYGGKDYHNYVTWKDGYFEFDGFVK